MSRNLLKPIMLIMICIFVICLSGCKKKQEPERGMVSEYDVLQEFFVSMTADTTIEELENWIEKNDLKFEIEKYPGSHSIEYTAGIEYEEGKRHPFTGDTIEVTFSSDDGSLKIGVYTKHYVSAIFFQSGTYWDLRDSSEKGYYGDVVGNHNYEKLSTAEEAIQYVYDHQKK